MTKSGSNKSTNCLSVKLTHFLHRFTKLQIYVNIWKEKVQMMLSKTKILSIYFLFLNLRMNPTGSFASKWNKSFLPRKSIGCKLFSPWKFVLWLLEFVFVDLWRTDTWSWLQEWSEELLFHFYYTIFYTIFTTRTDLHCRCCPQLLYFASCLKKSCYI